MSEIDRHVVEMEGVQYLSFMPIPRACPHPTPVWPVWNGVIAPSSAMAS